MILLQLVNIKLHRWGTLGAFFVQRAPPTRSISFPNCEEEFTYRFLLKGHRRCVNVAPEFELKLVEDLSFLTFGARS